MSRPKYAMCVDCGDPVSSASTWCTTCAPRQRLIGDRPMTGAERMARTRPLNKAKRGPKPRQAVGTVAVWRDRNRLPVATATDELVVFCWCQTHRMHVPPVLLREGRTWSCGSDCRDAR